MSGDDWDTNPTTPWPIPYCVVCLNAGFDGRRCLAMGFRSNPVLTENQREALHTLAEARFRIITETKR